MAPSIPHMKWKSLPCGMDLDIHVQLQVHIIQEVINSQAEQAVKTVNNYSGCRGSIPTL